MKKTFLTVAFVIALQTMSAQNEKIETTNKDFNKWSIELAGGFNRPVKPLNSAVTLVTPFTADLGVRYMFNHKFGLKADFGYNSLSGNDSTNDFDSRYYRVDLQGVVNLARVLNFETWTKTIGLLGHAGFGVAQLEDENSSGKDQMGNFIAGVTAQVKLSNRFVLTGDVTAIQNASQDNAFDFKSTNSEAGFSGRMYTGTLGLTYYLGKNENHADWVVVSETKELEDKLAALEAKLTQDTDNDGVADYKDEEPNSAAGAMVDTKGKTIIVKDSQGSVINTESDLKTLINGGYVAVYYDFNKSTPTADSKGSIDFILTYLRNNPSANVEITGYADELGSPSYNDTLSNERANNVKQTLVKANVNGSRLTIVGAGEDTSVDKSSDAARSLVRKVTFKLK